jgi:mannonate dehydratase
MYKPQGRARGASAPQAQSFHTESGVRHFYRTIPKPQQVRKQMGNDVELLHDIHERIPPYKAVQFAKPKDIGYFRQLREQCSTAIAVGGLVSEQIRRSRLGI